MYQINNFEVNIKDEIDNIHLWISAVSSSGTSAFTFTLMYRPNTLTPSPLTKNIQEINYLLRTSVCLYQFWTTMAYPKHHQGTSLTLHPGLHGYRWWPIRDYSWSFNFCWMFHISVLCHLGLKPEGGLANVTLCPRNAKVVQSGVCQEEQNQMHALGTITSRREIRKDSRSSPISFFFFSSFFYYYYYSFVCN